ncbi:MAG: hypothetical protein QM804_02100 [Propionicimonas sp.]
MLIQNEASWSLFWLNCILYTVLVVIRAWVDVLIPDRFLRPDSWWFRIRDWERDGEWYRDQLRIDRWKDKLPSLKTAARFSKKRLSAASHRYLDRFVTETCRAESNHLRAIGAVMVMRLWTPVDLWSVCLMLAIVGNLPFIMIQRYNRPRLMRALERIERRELAAAGGDPELRPATI